MDATPHDQDQPAQPGAAPFLPPRWVIRSFWIGHRAIVRLSGGRVGLTRPTPGGRFGMMRLHTTGRRSGKARVAILGYREEGDALVTLAMNGWAEPDPAWLLNLQAHPDARVDLDDRTIAVRARIAVGEERERLWSSWSAFSGYGGDVDGYARRRSRPTAVVVLEPRAGAAA